MEDFFFPIIICSTSSHRSWPNVTVVPAETCPVLRGSPPLAPAPLFSGGGPAAPPPGAHDLRRWLLGSPPRPIFLMSSGRVVASWT